MQLGELIEKMTTSDRLVIINAAGQVIYRGYAANFAHGTINPLRRVKRFGWIWKRTSAQKRCGTGQTYGNCRSRYQLNSWDNMT